MPGDPTVRSVIVAPMSGCAVAAKSGEHVTVTDVEITALLTLVNVDRFNAAFGIGSAGFSAGKVCVLPDRAPSVATLARDSTPA